MIKQTIKGVPDQLRKIVSAAASEYCWQLRMQHWKVLITYADKDKKPNEYDARDTVEASINVNRRYLEASITIYPVVVQKWKNKEYGRDDVDQIIAHEVSHLVTQHIFDVATATYRDEGEMKDAWETCTTVIGRLIHKLAKKKR